MNLTRFRQDAALDGEQTSPPVAWSNWSGSVKAHPRLIARPEDQEALASLMRDGIGPLRIVGAGHSFTPLSGTEATLIDMSAFSGLLQHDPQALTSTFGAAMTVRELACALHRIGQALPNMGDVDVQTYAGAISTGTHGTGHRRGAYHSHLQALDLVDARGRHHQLSRATTPELLDAAAVSLGSFGAITRVTIENVARYRLHRRRQFVAVEALLEDFAGLMQSEEAVEFFLIPHSDKGLLSRCARTDASATDRPPQDDEAALSLLRMLRTLTRQAPGLRRALTNAALRFVGAEDFVEEWYKAYPNARKTRFNEMEYHLPLAAGASVLRELIPMIERHFPRVYFPVEVRIVAADRGWLSPFYQRQSCSIAIHHDASEQCDAYFRAAEAIFLRHDGRPHWGKMHNLTAGTLKPLYPRFADAMAVRRDFDPENRLVTPYMARLFGLDS